MLGRLRVSGFGLLRSSCRLDSSNLLHFGSFLRLLRSGKALAVKADFHDAIHPAERQHDPASRRHASPHITESAAARGYRNLFARSKLKQFTDVACRSGKNDCLGLVRREPFIAAVRSERFRVVSDAFIAEQFPQL